MMLLQERALRAGELIEIELHDDLSYRLTYGTLVQYVPGQKKIRNRTSPYELKSVEKLRYDFERDVEALGGRLG